MRLVLTVLKVRQVGCMKDHYIFFFSLAQHMLLIILQEKLTLLQAKERGPSMATTTHHKLVFKYILHYI